jgi:hypothetical protein
VLQRTATKFGRRQLSIIIFPQLTEEKHEARALAGTIHHVVYRWRDCIADKRNRPVTGSRLGAAYKGQGGELEKDNFEDIRDADEEDDNASVEEK